MADETQNSQQPEKKQTKAIPGKPVESGELRKETVRINLPPKLGDVSKPGPAPTVRLPRPEGPAATTGAPPAPTVKLEKPTGQTTVLKVAGPASETGKKSDTAQVVTTPLPPPSGGVEAPKPTVKLRRAEMATPTTVLPTPSALAPLPTSAPAAAIPVPAPAAPAPASGFEVALSAVVALLAIGVTVVLYLANPR